MPTVRISTSGGGFRRPVAAAVTAAVTLAILPALAAAGPETPLTLAEALARAGRMNQSLAAAQQTVRGAEALVLQAGRGPNPALAVEWENLGGTSGAAGLGASELTASVSQRLELGGKRDRRRGTAAVEADLARWGLAQVHADLARRVTDAFVEVWLDQELAALATEKLALAEDLQEAVGRRLAAGAASSLELTRARVGVAQARIELRRLERTAAAAAGRLAGFWGQAEPDFGPVLLEADGSWSPPAATAEGLLAANPALGRLAADSRLQRARGELWRAEARPDLDLSLGLRSDFASGDKSLVLGVGVPLPVRDRNEGRIAAAEHDRLGSRLDYRAAATTAAAELAALGREWETARLEIRDLQAEILPLARQAYREIEAGHARGLYALTDVLETRRTLFELEAQRLGARADQRLIRARIESITGGSPWPGAPESHEVAE